MPCLLWGAADELGILRPERRLMEKRIRGMIIGKISVNEIANDMMRDGRNWNLPKLKFPSI